jgi:subtilisin
MRIRIILPSFVLPLCLLGLLFGVSPLQPGVSSQGKDEVTAAQLAAALEAQKQAAALMTRDESVQQRFQDLSAKLQRAKAVRVIVRLRVAWRPEGAMRQAAELLAQRAAIRQAQDELLNSVHLHNPRSIKRFKYLPNLAFSVDAAELEALHSAPQVMNIQADRFLKVAQALPPSITLIGAPNAWTSGYTGAGKNIAILDTGVDKTHSSLSQKVVSEACFSTDIEDSHIRSLCPGRVTESIAPDSGVNCTEATAGGTFPDCSHGTSVAGVALGVAKDAKLISIQVGSLVTQDDDPEGPCEGDAPCIRVVEADLMKGLDHVHDLAQPPFNYSIASANVGLSLHKNKFINTCDIISDVKPAIDQLKADKIATVVASGNDHSPEFTGGLTMPACVSSAISVGASGDGASLPAGEVAPYSNSASYLNLLAPGYFPSAPVPGVEGISSVSGTSFAAAHVSGAIAIIKQKEPDAEVSDVLNRLKSSSVYITDPRNGERLPRIQLEDALGCLQNVGADRWKGEYFDNTNLEGSPVMRRDDGSAPFLDKNFGDGGPGSVCIPGADNFSVRWTRTVDLPTTSLYRFSINADDGFRLYVGGGEAKLDRWNGPSGAHTVEVFLEGGSYEIILECREFGGPAYANLSWSRPCIAEVTANKWKGEYFRDDPALNNHLTGNPIMVRDDSANGTDNSLNFDWGSGGPDSACMPGVDNFSVRWTRMVNFLPAKYRFTVNNIDDGVRLYIGDQLIIDRWFDASGTYSVDADISEGGNRVVRLEFYEKGGLAIANVSWTPLPPDRPTVPSAEALSSSQIRLRWIHDSNTETGFRIERWNGSSFSQINTVGANVLTFTDTELSPVTTYLYRVKAFNSAGDSDPSDQVSATTIAPPPNPPSNLVATAVLPSQITLSWNDNNNFENGFQIIRSDIFGETQVYTVGANITAFTDSGLIPSKAYTYQVRAFNNIGFSSVSNLSSATTPPCSYSLNPASKIIGIDGGSFSVSVAADTPCSWTAASNNSWLSVSPGGGMGNGVVQVQVGANNSAQRLGRLTIAGRTFNVTQQGCNVSPPNLCP